MHSYLYNSTDGSRFYIKGVAYQMQGMIYAALISCRNRCLRRFYQVPLEIMAQVHFLSQASTYLDSLATNVYIDLDVSFIDPLADSAGCQRDLPLLQQLGVNTRRVYR